MKKSKYIGKYDYIDYYTKQKSMWFFSAIEIQAGLAAELKALKNKSSIKTDYFDDEDEAIEIEINDDYLEYYFEQKESGEDIDQTDPRVIEGIIIDQKSKEYVCSLYRKFPHYDFDSNEYKFNNNEKNAEITKKLIEDNEKLILFQPTFLYKNLVTKPDAFVKDKNKIFLIETKATSSAKIYHYLDLFFQKNVLEKQEFLNGFEFDYRICIIRYELLKKGEVSFITSNCFNATKSIPAIPEKEKKEMTYKEILEAQNLLKLGYKKMPSGEVIGVSFNDVMSNNFEQIYARYRPIDAPEKVVIFQLINENFDKVVEKLWTWKQKLDETSIPHGFIPSGNDNSEFKKCTYWNELKLIYIEKGYEPFIYSGNVINQDKRSINRIYREQLFKINESLIKGRDHNKNRKKYEKCYLGKEDVIYLENCNNLLNTMKDKKVYFDFETINTAIRSLDDTPPFAQIITQCSIIKSNDKPITEWNCDNLVCDPKNITIEFLKDMVDKLYEGNDASYIVYNKSFESSRLKECINYINDPKYTTKIQIIRQNLYDLADFFDCRKDYIVLEKLHGWHSIKKVLALIEDEDKEIFTICGCKDYKQLPVYNGAICQQQTIKRFFDMLSDEEWLELEHNLKVYCENDVRAMIAVELFIKKIVNNRFNELLNQQKNN